MGNKTSKQKGEEEESKHEELKTLEKPWREIERHCSINDEYKKKLQTEINEEAQEHSINILLVGLVKSGKSSFINSVASIDVGRIAKVTSAGGAGKSLTKKLKSYKPKRVLQNFKIFDTMGIEESQLNGILLRDILHIVKGHVPPDYQFNPATPIEKNEDSFRKSPSKKDRMHCVAFVVDANVFGNQNVSMDARQKIQELQQELEFEDIPHIVLLTKIDVLCKTVETDIIKAYESAKVKTAVDMVAHIFNIEENCIFPVQNFSKEMETNLGKEIFTLLAIRQMVRFASDFLNNHSDNEDEMQE